MAKMQENDASVSEFIESIEKERKRQDSQLLVDLFEDASGYPSKMWGDRIVGYGTYHYKYETGHEGDAPLVGFAPGKSNHMTLYINLRDDDKLEGMLDKLGKHRASISCVYVNKLADIDIDVLKEAVAYVTEKMKEDHLND